MRLFLSLLHSGLTTECKYPNDGGVGGLELMLHQSAIYFTLSFIWCRVCFFIFEVGSEGLPQ